MFTGSLITNGTTFEVTSGGVLTATGATLNTLTVKDSLEVSKGDVANGDATIHGTTWLKGNVYINTTSASGTGVSSSSG